MDSSTNKIAKTGYEAMSPEQYVDHVKALLKINNIIISMELLQGKTAK